MMRDWIGGMFRRKGRGGKKYAHNKRDDDFFPLSSTHTHRLCSTRRRHIIYGFLPLTTEFLTFFVRRRHLSRVSYSPFRFVLQSSAMMCVINYPPTLYKRIPRRHHHHLLSSQRCWGKRFCATLEEEKKKRRRRRQNQKARCSSLPRALCLRRRFWVVERPSSSFTSSRPSSPYCSLADINLSADKCPLTSCKYLAW